MNARVKAIGIIAGLYVILTCAFYEVVVHTSTVISPIQQEIHDLEYIIHYSDDVEVIKENIAHCDKLYE